MHDSIVHGDGQLERPVGAAQEGDKSNDQINQTDFNFWDDQSWQAMLEEFSMFPIAEGFQLG
jgi:hypothetical protein